MLGAIIREVREERRLSQRDLAAKLGRPQSAIAKIEAGSQRTDVVELLDIAKALNIGPAEIVERLEQSAAIRTSSKE